MNITVRVCRYAIGWNAHYISLVMVDRRCPARELFLRQPDRGSIEVLSVHRWDLGDAEKQYTPDAAWGGYAVVVKKDNDTTTLLHPDGSASNVIDHYRRPGADVGGVVSSFIDGYFGPRYGKVLEIPLSGKQMMFFGVPRIICTANVLPLATFRAHNWAVNTMGLDPYSLYRYVKSKDPKALDETGFQSEEHFQSSVLRIGRHIR